MSVPDTSRSDTQHAPTDATQLGSSAPHIGNSLFRDKRISGLAKGLFGLIATYRDGSELSVQTLGHNMKEGPGAIRVAPALEEHGYLHRKQLRDHTGCVTGNRYFITHNPAPKNHQIG
jgi:hypothetical protein